VYDRLFAARAGKRSTGHAAPPGGMIEAPLPQSIQMAGGGATLEELVAGVDRGLHITRFHYVNGFLDPRRTLMTGLTRDGTFLIEGGKRTRGVRNMRFTDSVFEAFARADGLTALREAVPTWWSDAGAFVAPAIRIRAFRFTGAGVAR
jgi:predicted Zn-dependent protease